MTGQTLISRPQSSEDAQPIGGEKRYLFRMLDISGKDVKIIATLNPVLRGWGNYFRTGNAADPLDGSARRAAEGSGGKVPGWNREDFESMAPVILTPQSVPLTEEEFVAFCRQYEDCSVECTADGEIVIMPPTYSITGKRNMALGAQLWMWARKDGRGEAYDSSAGFRFTQRRSPDASWIRKDRVPALPGEQRKKFYPLCPDFVVEILSSTDRNGRLKAKMEEYIANGAELGWPIEPEERTVWIYRPGRPAECVKNQERIPGEGPVEGFVLGLADIWA